MNYFLATRAEPAYRKWVFDSYSDLTAGKDIGADQIFDSFRVITGCKPKSIADFAKKHAAVFRY